ncbi:DUF4827 domain-containing protein [Xylanibacter muris]|uniref:DUF4827 domain-containing protein n=1 Tax=Xylanibacter muris TaxID=2736290 RepID=A0ABX2APG2_9BACT|nr:DUF4827 domain-containing protein [Xylanibacter muris]NPD92640.1 DUF4827 domain-containing protein [Xylanibacter muris]
MKRIPLKEIIFAIAALMTFTACDDYETYGDKKKKERSAIKSFIAKQGIREISEAVFHAQGDSTSIEKNEFVYLNNSGVYMQIENKGNGSELEEDKQINIICRYTEYNILNEYYMSRNDNTPRTYDKMLVQRKSGTYTAVFTSGVMYNTYGSSVPSGWLVPFTYLKIGRRTDNLAKVRLIVPHTQGQNTSVSNVIPCYYEITYQRER